MMEAQEQKLREMMLAQQKHIDRIDRLHSEQIEDVRERMIERGDDVLNEYAREMMQEEIRSILNSYVSRHIQTLREEAQSALASHLDTCTSTLNTHQARLLTKSYELVNELERRQPTLAKVLQMVRNVDSIPSYDEMLSRTNILQRNASRVEARVNEAEQGVQRALHSHDQSKAHSALTKVVSVDDALRRVTVLFFMQVSWILLTWMF